MANNTVYEFTAGPDERGDLEWPADVITTAATAGSVTLAAGTRYIEVTTDTSGRIAITAAGTAAVASGSNISSAAPSRFKVRGGSICKFA